MDSSDSNPYGPKPRRSLRSSPRKSPYQEPVVRTLERRKIPSSDGSDLDSDIEPDSYERSHPSLYDDLNEEIAKHRAELLNDSNRKNTSFGSNTSQRRKHETSQSQANGMSSQDWTVIYVAMLAVVCAILVIYMFGLGKRVVRVECPQFKDLNDEFTNQDKLLFKSLKINIENVMNQTPAQPSVFLLAYNDVETSKNMMAKILNVTANCMKSQNPIQLEGGSFATEAMIQDYGEIIAKYRTRLEQEGILYVTDINKTPAKAAQVFHTICDTITPLVERSVIFFTMYVDQYDRDMSPQRIHEVVEHQLETNWDAINHNTLKALIGRVTDQVFMLHAENGDR